MLTSEVRAREFIARDFVFAIFGRGQLADPPTHFGQIVIDGQMIHSPAGVMTPRVKRKRKHFSRLSVEINRGGHSNLRTNQH